MIWRTVLVLLWFVPGFVAADDFRPLYVEIVEQADEQYLVRVKLPPTVQPGNAPEIVFPEFCQGDPGRGNVQVCRADIAGQNLLIRYPAYTPPNSTVVRMRFVTGQVHTMTLSSGVQRFVVPSREDVAGVAAQYTWLGMEHIWIGFDHLLFVLCLIWIAGQWRRILVTITGFTLAHSVTLVLAAMEVVTLPVPPIEAVIALSVLFLATEITRGRRSNLTWRYPVAVSTSFGLLHGLGFAAVLSEIGLPQLELVTGLVFFNIGVEIGQVGFALVVVALLALLRRWSWFLVHGQVTTGYIVGIISAYWFIERTAAFMI
ncbi:MAG: HupE/UreJ family protein [Proteobacteria bacterium]|nr:HupE/UreJ family protein [Pseudomonadota bacterium]